MNCPFCGSSQIFVTNSRDTKGETQIWRRRKCAGCGGTFTTYERINLSYLTVVKKSGKKQRYNRAKLFSSIYHSMLDQKGADRGDMGNFSEEVTSDVEQEILKLRKKYVQTREITAIILRLMKKKCPGTFLRFLAYREERDERSLKKYLRDFLTAGEV